MGGKLVQILKHASMGYALSPFFSFSKRIYLMIMLVDQWPTEC